jgi:hypothetical protein
VSDEKNEGSDRDPFVWFVCKMLLTFFTVIAVDLVAVSLLTHKLRVWFPVHLTAVGLVAKPTDAVCRS